MVKITGSAGGDLAGSVSDYNTAALDMGPQEVREVFSLSSSGQLNFDEEAYAKLDESQQKNVQGWIKSNYTETEDLIAGFSRKCFKSYD